MKTILEQKAFNFSSLFVAACLVVPLSVAIVLDDLIPGIIFSTSAILFLFFICRFNLRIHHFNSFVSSYMATYLGYTFLVLLQVAMYLMFEGDFSIEEYFGTVGIYLMYGYVLCFAISLIVYLLYKAIIFYKNNES